MRHNGVFLPFLCPPEAILLNDRNEDGDTGVEIVTKFIQARRRHVNHIDEPGGWDFAQKEVVDIIIGGQEREADVDAAGWNERLVAATSLEISTV